MSIVLQMWRRSAVPALVAGLLIVGAPPAADAQTERVEYYALDAIGSVRVVFDAGGNILGRMDYGPFGMDLNGATGMPPERFAGLTRDGEAGLDYAHARMYQWRTGRFNSPEPVYGSMFDPQQWNRYAYAGSSPLNFADPSGLREADINITVTGDHCLYFPASCFDYCHYFPAYCAMEGTGGGGSGWMVLPYWPGGNSPWYPDDDPSGLGHGGGSGQTPIPPGANPNPPQDPPPPPPPPDTSNPGAPETLTPEQTGDWKTCTSRWSFSSTARVLGGDTVGTIGRVAEVLSPISLLSDGAAMLAKGSGALGTKNPYASGLAWGVRKIGRCAVRQGLIKATTWGTASTVSGYLSAVVLAPVGVFTSAYNGTVMVQCAVGALR